MTEVYMDYTDSRGKKHKIVKGYIPEQCDAYKKAKEKGDVIAMHYLHLPYTERPMYQINAAIRMIELPYECEDRTEHMMKRIELEVKLDDIKRKRKVRSRLIWGATIAGAIATIL